MTTPLFSTYRQGENRVTATCLAVLQRLSQPSMDRILRTLLGEDTFSLVSFENQPRAKESVPDAIIRGSTIWVETKTQRESVRRSQIERHLQVVTEGQRLLVLTPDDDRPAVLEEVDESKDRLAWSNFSTLHEVIRDIVNDKEDPPSERESYLLNELVLMLRHDGLLDRPANVAVVAASSGWEMYRNLPVYRCALTLPLRTGIEYMAFYSGGEIKRTVPRVRAMVESLNLADEESINSIESPETRELARRLCERIDCKGRWNEFEREFKVVFLSEAGDSSETVTLPHPITNDKKSSEGKTVAFTMGRPRYFALRSLEETASTSGGSRTTELERRERERRS